MTGVVLNFGTHHEYTKISGVTRVSGRKRGIEADRSDIFAFVLAHEKQDHLSRVEVAVIPISC